MCISLMPSPLVEAHETTVFLNTRKPEQRYYVLKFEGNEAVGMCSNIFERYEKRPREHPDFDFPNICYRQAVKVGAPTGVAARLVGGQTLHALLRLPVQVDGTVTGPLHPLTGNIIY
ncbi:hypothetical protein PVAND_012578 [Polypedilum vanderplanki]|uniref:Uncharacterized protein n=1 Tax=Polypedilum vanderplanki TaxID=319348 RepID=A0A9J6CLY0_POLVA|nr:hypothetical protein PVAND_012578 [Polypedilum vanderplanki]